ncbi:MAG: heme-binding domain-containing protein [Cyclobacteriaceae bacterium]|nr:heme-binding domain-containing protein [Cyclobacteriaceae bacterium]
MFKTTRVKVTAVVLGALIIFQLIPLEKHAGQDDPSKDIITVEQVNDEVAGILKKACYDCHSIKTSYPWYAGVAPVSWWIVSHVNEGREHLDFSNWTDYDAKKRDHKLEELGEEVEEGGMPLNTYLWMHEEARLTQQERTLLIDWAKGLRGK